MNLSKPQVWADNLDEELDVLRGMIEKYPVVSMVSLFDLITLHLDAREDWVLGRGWEKSQEWKGS